MYVLVGCFLYVWDVIKKLYHPAKDSKSSTTMQFLRLKQRTNSSMKNQDSGFHDQKFIALVVPDNLSDSLDTKLTHYYSEDILLKREAKLLKSVRKEDIVKDFKHIQLAWQMQIQEEGLDNWRDWLKSTDLVIAKIINDADSLSLEASMGEQSAETEGNANKVEDSLSDTTSSSSGTSGTCSSACESSSSDAESSDESAEDIESPEEDAEDSALPEENPGHNTKLSLLGMNPKIPPLIIRRETTLTKSGSEVFTYSSRQRQDTLSDKRDTSSEEPASKKQKLKNSGNLDLSESSED
jgi:hypothetical protein